MNPREVFGEYLPCFSSTSAIKYYVDVSLLNEPPRKLFTDFAFGDSRREKEEPNFEF